MHDPCMPQAVVRQPPPPEEAEDHAAHRHQPRDDEDALCRGRGYAWVGLRPAQPQAQPHVIVDEPDAPSHEEQDEPRHEDDAPEVPDAPEVADVQSHVQTLPQTSVHNSFSHTIRWVTCANHGFFFHNPQGEAGTKNDACTHCLSSEGVDWGGGGPEKSEEGKSLHFIVKDACECGPP